jgi:hypothetical protein
MDDAVALTQATTIAVTTARSTATRVRTQSPAETQTDVRPELCVPILGAKCHHRRVYDSTSGSLRLRANPAQASGECLQAAAQLCLDAFDGSVEDECNLGVAHPVVPAEHHRQTIGFGQCVNRSLTS